MGTLVLAAAGSCNIKIAASHTRVSEGELKAALCFELFLSTRHIVECLHMRNEIKLFVRPKKKKVHKICLADCKHYFSLFRRNLSMPH